MGPEHSQKPFLSKIKASASYSASLQLVLLFGFVSLTADMTYEGARSILGPFLSTVGATGSAIGFIAGLGELTGYVVRIFAGSIGDKTKGHWAFVYVGYFINQIAVPLLALARSWPQVACLVVLERLGKGIRSPSRDVLLSTATEGMGRGIGFGIHEALDQLGAMIGPLLVSLAMIYWKNYRTALGFLFIPAFFSLLFLFITHNRYKKAIHAITDSQEQLEREDSPSTTKAGLGKEFWIYITALGFIAMGYVDFPLIAYHLGKRGLFNEYELPLLYTLAMGIDAVVALVAGKLFDKSGISSMIWPIIMGSLASPLIFVFPLQTLALVGMIFWGIGLGVQESVVRAALASLVPPPIRGRAFGIYYFVFGLFWFLGSFVLGFLYDHSTLYVAVCSFLLQIMAIPMLQSCQRKVSELKNNVQN